MSNSYIDPLDYEENPEFFEWLSLEGSEKIDELSRQLRSFLNYKCSVIRLRYSKSNVIEPPKKNIILKSEDELSILFSRYVKLLKEIGINEGNITEMIKTLIDQLKSQPNSYKLKTFKEIKSLSGEIWKKLHLLSEFEIHPHSSLLNIVIQIACVLCEIQGALYLPFLCFYEELKHNYTQLADELSILLQRDFKGNIKTKKNKERVKILA